MVSMDLWYRLQQQRCAEKGNVHAHFAMLHMMRKDLAAMGHAPSEDNFYAIILGSLPKSFESFISALNATASILGSNITCDNLMKAVTDDYDHQNLGKGAKKEENAAFYSNEGRASGSGHGKKTSHGPECFNCYKRGHKKSDCWAKGRGKEGQWPKGKGSGKDLDKGKGKETAASVKEREAEEAWMTMSAFVDSDSEFDNFYATSSAASSFEILDQLFEDQLCMAIEDGMPDLVSHSDSDDEIPGLNLNTDSDSDSSSDSEDISVLEKPESGVWRPAAYHHMTIAKAARRICSN